MENQITFLAYLRYTHNIQIKTGSPILCNSDGSCHSRCCIMHDLDFIV